jgi:hypothetical protein
MWDNEAVPSDNEDSIGCALSALQAGDSDDGEDEPANTATMGAVSASANGPSEFSGQARSWDRPFKILGTSPLLGQARSWDRLLEQGSAEGAAAQGCLLPGSGGGAPVSTGSDSGATNSKVHMHDGSCVSAGCVYPRWMCVSSLAGCILAGCVYPHGLCLSAGCVYPRWMCVSPLAECILAGCVYLRWLCISAGCVYPRWMCVSSMAG